MHYTPLLATGFAAVAAAAPAPAPRNHKIHGFGDGAGFRWWGWSTGTAGAPAPTWTPKPFPSGGFEWPSASSAAASVGVPAASSVAVSTPVAATSVAVPAAPTSEVVVVVPTTAAAVVSKPTHKASTKASTKASIKTTSKASSAVVATSTEAAASSATSADATTYSGIALQQHNLHRANHSATALTYNTELAGYAATLAATCVFDHDTSIGEGVYGQNLAASASTDSANSALAEAITEGWYNEEVNYFDGLYGQAQPSMDNFDKWGHFTQVVWQDTQSVGCATQVCAAGTLYDGIESYYTVCNYLAAGNYENEYADNVKESLGQATYSVA